MGLFKDPANARKRRDQIVTAGFPAQMSERTETVPEYWLDLIPVDSSHFDWRSRIHDPANRIAQHRLFLSEGLLEYAAPCRHSSVGRATAL